MENEFAAVDAGEKVLPDEGHERERKHASREEDNHENLAMADRAGQQPVIPLAELLKPYFEFRLHADQRISRFLRSARGVPLPSARRAGTAPWWAPASATADRKPASQTPPLPPSGTKRYLATPERKNIGTNTMQIESVDTSAGTAICEAPSRIAWMISLPWSRLRLMFSTSTVASSTRMPTASARPPSVMMLIVSPSALSTISEVSTESGIETAMISVLRQLPRNSENHETRKAGRDRAFADHAVDRRFHENRLVGQRVDIEVHRQGGLDRSAAFCFDAVNDVERRSVSDFQDRHQRPRAVRPRARCWSAAETVPDVATSLNVDRRAVDGLDRQIVQSLDRERRSVHVHLIFVRADLGRAGGKNQVLRVDRVHHVERRKPLGLQRRRIQIDHNLSAVCRHKDRESATPGTVISAVRIKFCPMSARSAAR